MKELKPEAERKLALLCGAIRKNISLCKDISEREDSAGGLHDTESGSSPLRWLANQEEMAEYQSRCKDALQALRIRVLTRLEAKRRELVSELRILMREEIKEDA